MINPTPVQPLSKEGLIGHMRGFKRASWPEGIGGAGFFMAGYMCLLGILCFSLGEMLVSLKMNEYLGVIAPEGEKALYMGYANIPMTIGWAYGSFMAGNIYDKMGDKANLAIRYLAEDYNITENITRPEAMIKMQEYLNINAVDAPNLLWKTYNP
ncbi:MAG: hypothetical protein JSU85_02030 [Candidatus Zixiibacteriota bacterium]|nr:MAG: hypothetical protein JSU85_02030 [candidate division Zixibacteria bacterium]